MILNDTKRQRKIIIERLKSEREEYNYEEI